MTRRTVLFVCVENAGRSLMAEAIFNATAPAGWVAASAGTQPAAAANPRTREVLQEIGLELPDHPPQLLSTAMVDRAEMRITMGCLDQPSCPASLRGSVSEDWALPDPSRLDDAGFRRVRDEIVRRVSRLRTALGNEHSDRKV